MIFRKMVFLLSLPLMACTHPQGVLQAMPLGGTSWQLYAIQSMDDAQGTTLIAKPLVFTLRFEANQQARFRLDCNQATSTWEAHPVSDSSGCLRFSWLAATRALCTVPDLNARILGDLPFVRSYLLKDGKLFMSLMADGGIYEWRPYRD